MKILKSKKFIRTFATLFVGTMIFATVTEGASLTKKIDATFRGIKVFYNNQQKTMTQEPFIYNGSVYLPVRAVAELVGKNVEWNNASNSVYVTDTGTATNTSVQVLQNEIASKNFEIAKITAEKKILEDKIKELETSTNSKTATGDLKKTLEYLEDHFDYEHSIEWDFKLTQTSSRINVEVVFDSKSYGTKWDRLSKSSRESFFRDICREIRIDHKDIAINGKVIDDRTDKTVGTFSYSKSNSFSYTDESSTSFSDLEKDLKKYFTKVDGNIFIDKINIKGDEDDITYTVVVTLDTRSLQNEWDDLVDRESSSRIIRDLMQDIEEEILRDYKYATVEGFIEDYNNSYNKIADYSNSRVKAYYSR